MLHPSNHPEQQALAAWAMGTAVKNSYDFQLWILQSEFSHPSVLSLKKNKTEIRSDIVHDNYDIEKMNFEKLDTGDLSSKNIDETRTNIKNSNAISINVKNSKNNNTNLLTENNLNNKKKNEKLSAKNESNDIIKTKTFFEEKITGLEKLVSLLHWSQNKPNFDELQRKVLYAISSCARGNVEVQESLQKIDESDLYPLISYNKSFYGNSTSNSKNKNDNDNSNNENKNDNSNNDIQNDDDNNNNNNMKDDSIFMKYLTSIVENDLETFSSNTVDDNENEIKNKNDIKNNKEVYEVSFDLSKKIWSFISDMLEERSYIRGDLTLFQDLPKDAITQLLSFKLFGDLFLNEKWLDLAIKNFEKLFDIYETKTEIGIAMNIEINSMGEVESNNNSDNVLDLSSQNTLRALIKNVLIVIKEILNQNENLKNDFDRQFKKYEIVNDKAKSNLDAEIEDRNIEFLLSLSSVIKLSESEMDGMADEAKSILNLLSLA